MDALNQLIQDHRKVAELFEQFEATENEQECQRIFQQIHQELEVHTQLEETALYPALQQYEELKDITLEAIDRYGSISQAAKAVPLSYKAAWDAVDAMNNLAESMNYHVEPADAVFVASLTDRVRQGLGDRGFADAIAMGRAATLDQALHDMRALLASDA